MIIWRGWGVLAILYAGFSAGIFGGLLSKSVDSRAIPLLMGLGLLLAALATWFTGVALNQRLAERRIEAWSQQRRARLHALVQSGQFSLGAGEPQPRSIDEAGQMAEVLFQLELEEITRAHRNRHTLFWIPMQYFAFAWAALGVFGIVTGIVQLNA